MKNVPEIVFTSHDEDRKKAFGDYDIKSKSIRVRAGGRHPLDVMRTVAHELTHHNQIIQGRAGNEDEANAIAGRIMRKYDMMHPNEFKDKIINEDGSVGAVNSTGPAVAGLGGPSGEPPGVPPKKRKLREVIKSPVIKPPVIGSMIKRKAPVNVG